MFKYLLHSSLASYDAATKKWTFDLDRRISNPTSLRLAKAAYSTVTPAPTQWWCT